MPFAPLSPGLLTLDTYAPVELTGIVVSLPLMSLIPLLQSISLTFTGIGLTSLTAFPTYRYYYPLDLNSTLLLLIPLLQSIATDRVRIFALLTSILHPIIRGIEPLRPRINLERINEWTINPNNGTIALYSFLR